MASRSVLTGVVAGALLGMAELQQPKTLHADRLVAREVMVEDGEKHLLAMLSAERKANGLRLTHMENGTVAALETAQGTSGLYLASPGIGSSVFGQSAERAGFVSLTPQGASEPLVELACEREGASLTFHDGGSGALCGAGFGPRGPFFMAKKGNARIALIAPGQGISLGIKDGASRTRVWADVEPAVGAGLKLLDGAGTARALLSVQDDQGAAIRLNDCLGHASWSSAAESSR